MSSGSIASSATRDLQHQLQRTRSALQLMLEQYGRLHDALSDAIEGGRLTEADVPDDYQALVSLLVAARAADEVAKAVANEVPGDASDAPSDQKPLAPLVFGPGMRVTAKMDFRDGDENNQERITRAGEVGWIHSRSHIGVDGKPAWAIHFPSGAVLTFEDADLRDPGQVEVREMTDQALLSHVLISVGDGLGALDAADHQIGQMRGMFDDSDGTIAEAVAAATEATSSLSFARTLLKDRLLRQSQPAEQRAHTYGLCTISGPDDDVAFILQRLPDADGPSVASAPDGSPQIEGAESLELTVRFRELLNYCDADWWQAYTSEHREACETAAEEINEALFNALEGGAERAELEQVGLSLLSRHCDLGFNDTEPRYMLAQLMGDLFGEEDACSESLASRPARSRP